MSKLQVQVMIIGEWKGKKVQDVKKSVQKKMTDAVKILLK